MTRPPGKPEAHRASLPPRPSVAPHCLWDGLLPLAPCALLTPLSVYTAFSLSLSQDLCTCHSACPESSSPSLHWDLCSLSLSAEACPSTPAAPPSVSALCSASQRPSLPDGTACPCVLLCVSGRGVSAPGEQGPVAPSSSPVLAQGGGPDGRGD